jgi:GTP-binding protein EngB required for normal cell division
MLVPCERLPYEEEFPISSLHAYVTEEGNPGNRRQIKAVYVEVSSPFLRRGLEFVDTPGIGSAIEANTETTYRFLPQCDAVLFVTSIDSPLTGAEILFLRDLRRYVRKVFFVVNKSDLLEEAERSQVLEFVRNSLRREMATNEIRMFPVSARAGLAAKLTNNQQGIDAAGISDLEAELAAFLAAERATTLLVAIVDQAARLIDAECRDINHKPASNPVPLSSINHPMTDAEQAARIAGLRSRLELLRTSVLSGVVPEVTIENPPPDDSASASVAATPPSVERDAAALATRGCPVCDYVAQSLFDFFRHFQYSLATEESAQKLFAEELGFCPFHTWHLGTLSSTLGISAGYPRLIERLATELSALALEPAESAARVTRLLARPQTCRACHFVREVEARYVHRMADLLAGSTYREQFARSEGVCLRHLAMLLQVSPGQETLRFLLKDAARHCQEVAEDMHSYVIKREATRRALLNQDEQDAHVRALTHLVGHRYLASLDLPDMEF